MGTLDERFALIRYGGQPWYADSIADRKTGVATFRVSQRGSSRDAFDQAEDLTDLETVARRVILEGKRMRCRPKNSPKANSLDLRSDDVDGYRLDPALATRLGVPAEGGPR